MSTDRETVVTGEGKVLRDGINYYAVRISDLGGSEIVTYIARSQADCKDATDLSVYREVLRSADVITMGKIIGEPLSTWPGFGKDWR